MDNRTLQLVRASDGILLEIDSLPQVRAYNGDGTLDYVTVTLNGVTYKQSFTYTTGRITAISAWVKQ